MIELKHLRLITTIEREGSLKEAARALHLTQSALSHQLRQLEASIGHKVFHRRGNKLIFTEGGKEFREKAGDILSEVSSLEDRMREIGNRQPSRYIHGYTREERRRLQDQAATVADYLHYDSYWEAGATVLEAGCGVGAQTEIISALNPEVSFVAVDVSESSVRQARRRLDELSRNNVAFRVADLHELDYPDGAFDHVFVCFVLEHVTAPAKIIRELYRVLKPGGTITLVEGDHGSTYFYPDSPHARAAVAAQVELQRRNGGNANVGRELYPLLSAAKLRDISVSPRVIYVDPGNPELVDGFIRKTFTAMIKGCAAEAVARGVITATAMEKGVEDLYRVAEEGGVFCYTFFKGVGRK